MPQQHIHYLKQDCLIFQLDTKVVLSLIHTWWDIDSHIDDRLLIYMNAIKSYIYIHVLNCQKYPHQYSFISHTLSSSKITEMNKTINPYEKFHI